MKPEVLAAFEIMKNEKIVKNKDGLYPCPFCGNEPYFTKCVNGTNMNKIGCSDCGIVFKAMRTDITLGSPMTKDIHAAWNKRT